MDDLISRKAAINSISNLMPNLTTPDGTGSNDNEIFSAQEMCVDALQSLHELPAIDAVPVVRCRECLHYKEFRTKRKNQLMRFCYRMGKCDMEYHVNPNDFCSYGQRREGD